MVTSILSCTIFIIDEIDGGCKGKCVYKKMLPEKRAKQKKSLVNQGANIAR